MTYSHYDRRPSGSSAINIPHAGGRRSSGDYRPKPMQWSAKAAARDSGISMASMSMSITPSPESSPRDSFFRNSIRDSGISMYSPRDSFFKNSLRDSGSFSAQVIPEEAAWTQTRLQQEEDDLVLIEEEEEEDEEDKEVIRQRMRERDSGILTRSTSLSSQTVPPSPSTLVSSTHAAEQLADEATTHLLTGDWSTTAPADEIPLLDNLLAKGGALNATAHLPVALAPPACATIEAEADEETPGRGGIVTISPLRVALHNYTQARTSLCQGNRDVFVQKDTFLHLVERGADFWTRLSKDNDSPLAEEVAPECQPRRRGSSVFEDLIGFTAQHYAGGPSFSLPLVKAMIEKNPRRLSSDDLTWAFEKIAACGSLGSVDVPVGRYLLSLPGVTPQGHYMRQFQMLDDEYLRGDWRARGRQFAGRRFAEACDEF